MEWQRSRLPSCEVSEMLCERPSQSQADDILFIHVCLWSVRNIMWWVVIHGIHQMLLNDWMNVHMFRDSLCWIQSESSSDTLHSSKHVTKCCHRTITFNTSSGRAPQFAHFLFFCNYRRLSDLMRKHVSNYTHLFPQEEWTRCYIDAFD